MINPAEMGNEEFIKYARRRWRQWHLRNMDPMFRKPMPTIDRELADRVMENERLRQLPKFRRAGKSRAEKRKAHA